MTSTPPLLMLAEGRRPRPRKAAVPRPKELALHLSVVRLLRIHGRPDWCWTHFPAGERRDPRTAAKLRAMGLQPGWPDLVFVGPDGRFYGIELKRAGGKLSPAQEEFRRFCIARGIAHSIIENLSDARAVLTAWGVISEGANEK